jgi:hypothetical protein
MKPARWLLLLLTLGLTNAAHAYPFMIRHGYTQCSTCQTDPSGGTFLKEYGRAQSELLLSSSYGGDAASEDAQEEPTAGRFLGFIPLPSWFRPGGWVREGYIWNAEGPTFGCASTRGGDPTTTLLLGLVVALRLAAGSLCRRRGREPGGEATPGVRTSADEATPLPPLR